MKKSFVALLLILGAAASMTSLALADEGLNGDLSNKLVNSKASKERLSRAARQGTASIAAPGDTTWIGHKVGGFGPWKIGTGPNAPNSGNNDGIWDWEVYGGETDSLQGWWPFKRAYSITGGLTLADTDRPWWALEFGNVGNYVLNSQQQNRTFGVMGYWHVDGGNNFPGPGNAITWAPLNGTGSAWCGIRAHGDNQYKDNVTLNPINATILEYQGETGSGSGTAKKFPGYTSQMDQMLYRDVEMTSSAATLNLSFSYKTVMSTLTGTAAATRAGWFTFDPTTISAVSVAGPNSGKTNYVQNTGAGSPADSFLVYLGCPVDPAGAWTDASNTPHAKVYDPYRRWLSEVVALDKPIEEVLSVGGNTNTTFTLTGKALSAYYNAQGGANRYLRVVFRVHTNAGSSDLAVAAGSFNSDAAGAALIDDVAISGANLAGGAFGTTNFNQITDINNALATSATAQSAWVTTGKPPGIFFHTHPLLGADINPGVGVNNYNALVYQDICGPPSAAVRFCNMSGVVISAGTHPSERSGGVAGVDLPGETERMDGIMSPTVNLMSTGSGDFNGMGIDADIATVNDDIYVWYDIYTGVFNLFFTGNAWTFGFQSYPATQAVGAAIKCWGEVRIPGFQIFNPDIQCLQDIEGAYANGLIKTSNGGGVPDSIRVFLGKNQQCFRFGVSGSACSPNSGCYFDNTSIGINNEIVGGGGGGLATSVDIWRFINDAFPRNETPGLPGTASFDTCAAIIQTGINIAQSPGDANRFDIAGDSTLVLVDLSVPERVDMSFRIKPGPGNYHTIGNASSGLRPVPTDAVNTVTSGDASFWGQYMANQGTFAGGTHTGAPSGWNVNAWNTARCDTANFGGWRNETTGSFLELETLAGTGAFAATYEETDAHFNTLGISRRFCFQNNPAVSATSANLICNGTLPTWVTAGAGYNSVAYNPPNQALTNSTKEGTKIIPDGLLTPGSHVQYFFTVRELSNLSNFVMVPETMFVSPQFSEGSTDAHRFQEFTVLPDRWKFGLYGGDGVACMLYVDLNDRRGNERVWVSVADSIGATKAARRGAHNGWKADGNQQYTDANGFPIDITGTSMQVAAHGGAPGTTWDMYGVKASESLTTSAGALGCRFAPTATGLAAGKDAKMGPTPEMLNLYSVLMILTGDLNSGIFGQFINRGQNDITILTTWLAGTTNRSIYIAGDGFAQSEYQTGQNFANHATLLNGFLGVNIRIDAGVQAYSYQPFTNDFRQYIDVAVKGPAAATNAGVYSVGNACLWGNDILAISGVGPVSGGEYSSTGGAGPYLSGVYFKPGGSKYESYVDGWDIEHLYSRYGNSSVGRLGYYFNLFTTIQAFAGCAVQGSPLITLGVDPGNDALVDYMMVKNNVLRSGVAKVDFGLARGDRVQIRVYDVAGRAVRTLANKYFEAGRYSLPWDGSDDSGVQLARGVYFAQVRYANSKFADAKRLIVLK